MKQHDDYIAGPHHYWIHFWCGLVFGAGAGAWIGSEIFDSGWLVLIATIVAASSTALMCGRWGDRGWYWMLHKLRWFS